MRRHRWLWRRNAAVSIIMAADHTNRSRGAAVVAAAKRMADGVQSRRDQSVHRRKRAVTRRTVLVVTGLAAGAAASRVFASAAPAEPTTREERVPRTRARMLSGAAATAGRPGFPVEYVAVT